MRKSELRQIIREEISKLEGRNLTEVRATLKTASWFFEDSKHGRIILNDVIGGINGGTFKRQKLVDYFDELADRLGDIRALRIMEFMARDIGINHRIYNNKPYYKFEAAMCDGIEKLWYEYQKKFL